MKRSFVCASSRIKHYVQPIIFLPWDARSRGTHMCVYTTQKNYYIIFNYIKVYTETRTKNIKKIKKVGMLLQKRVYRYKRSRDK